MSEIFNRQPQKRTRQKLRKQPIIAEKRLWSKLRHQELGYKFRRQHGIGKYIVDFYCPAASLVIEVDGSQHFEPENQFYDEERTAYLETLGLRVIRFTNRDVLTNIEGVVLEIMKYL